MSSKKQLAAELILKQEFTLAKQTLEEEQIADKQDLYLLSLLYRYHDEYEKELQTINKSLELNIANEYMQAREKWHNLPLYEKQVPRKQIFIDDAREWREQLLYQTTVITGCDDNPTYFNLLIGLLESLNQLPTYKNVDINLLDCGMTDEQKHFLLTHFSIKNVVIPEYKFNIKCGYMAKEMTARPFLPEYFPGYRYYFHLDVDMWIQDEHALDNYLLLASKQGIGLANHFGEDVKFWGEYGCTPRVISPDFWQPNLLQKIHFCNAGAFCIDNNSNIFGQYKECLIANLKDCGASHASEQSALNCAIAHNWPVEVLPPPYNFMILHLIGKEGYKDFLSKNGQIFLYQGQNVGIVHLSGLGQNPDRHAYVSLHDIESNKKEEVALHFQVWPWTDKSQICELLLNEAQQCI